MQGASETEITRLISDWQQGNREAEAELFDVLYRALHEMASHCLQSEANCRTLGPTALVHEAYLRLTSAHRLEVSNRAHFLSLTARIMRRLIVDKARARKAQKRGDGAAETKLLDSMARSEVDADRIIAIDKALNALAQRNERQAKLVELRYFAGMSMDEAAAVLLISGRTARREWDIARLRLKEAIDGTRLAV